MLSMHKINSADYYVNLAAAGYDEYLAGDGEAPGRWLGQGLAEFVAVARAADIDVPESVRVGETIDKDGAELLKWIVSQESADTLFPDQRKPARTRKDRENADKQAAQGKAGKAAGEYCAAFDLTFSAPKGFSIYAEMTDDAELRKRLHGCHDRAVERAVAYGEQVACWGREGTDGVDVVPGTGFVAAAFRHRTARPPEKAAIPDPDTHTHVLVGNHVQHPDGTYGALDGRAIYAWKMAAGAYYRTALLEEAEREGIHLPWVVTNAARGLVEVDIPADLLEATSRRRNQIKEAAERLGLTSQAGMRTATLATREAKMTDAAHAPEATLPAMLRSRPELDDLSDEAKATLAGVVAGDLPDRGEALQPLTDAELDSIAAELVSEASTWPQSAPGQHEPPPGHLTATTSTFRHPQVVAALAWRAMGTGTSPEAIDAAATRLLESSEAVQLGGPAWQRRWSTREILLLEDRIIRMAQGGVGAGAGAVSDATADAILEKNAWLSDEQAAMVRHVTTSGNAVDVVVGAAGSGKTAALKVANEAWVASGIRVIGCAHAARAAQGLEDGSGVRSRTMASLLMELRREDGGLPAGCVVVVDETSMTDTRPVAELATAVAAANGKLVLVGDHRQLQAVGAGGVYRALVGGESDDEDDENEDNRIVVELLGNRRQNEAWERSVLARLREDEDGSGVRKAVEAWTEHGRLHMHEDLPDAYAACVRGWLADTDAGKQTAMIATRVEDAAALAGLARAVLVERGDIEDGIEATPGGLKFAEGDRVICLKNNSRIGVRNGNAGTVTGVDVSPRKHNVTLRVHLDHGENVVLPTTYLDAGNVAYGHGTSNHKVQGATLDTAHVLGTSLGSREAAYVAASRHRESVTIHTVDPKAALRDSGMTHGLEIVPDATDAFVDQISGRSEEWAASHYGPGKGGVAPIFVAGLGADEARHLFQERLQLAAQMITEVHGEAKRVDKDTLARYDEATGTLRLHARQLGQQAVITRPPHVTKALGDPPLLPQAERRWIGAAGAIEAYRERWEITGDSTLGTGRVTDPAQTQDRERVERIIEAVVGVPEPVVTDEDEDTDDLAQAG